MSLDDVIDLSELVSPVFSSANRLYTFYSLADGRSAREVAEDLEVTRNAVQHYISDFQEAGLLKSSELGYSLTEKGETVNEWIEQIIEEI